MSRKLKKTYIQEFKIEAVKLITEQGYSILKAARNLGMSDNALGKWKRTLENEGNAQLAFPGKGHPRDVELAALRKELERTKRERYFKKLKLGRQLINALI